MKKLRQITSRKRRKVFQHRSPPGSAPGTLVSDSAAGGPHLHVFLYDSRGVQESRPTTVAEIPAIGEGQVLWLDVDGLGNAAVVEAIGQRFNLHSLALEDVLHVHQRAKAEEYPNHIFIVVRALEGAESADSEQISVFLGKNFVITFQERPGDCFEAVRNRLRQIGKFRSRGADFLVYSLIDATIDAYFPRLERFSTRLDELDDLMTHRINRKLMGELHEMRRSLIQLRKLTWQHREAVNTLSRIDGDFISADTHIHLRDIQDHIVQLMDVAETDRESCLSLQELYLSEISQRTNDVMKTLTLIATLFMPMSFVAGVYGMNFNTQISPWNMPELNWALGYPFALMLMALLGGSLLTMFWLRGWFGE